MSEQNKLEESKWIIVCKRVRLWAGRPQPGGFKSLWSVGGSDSGRLEYNGTVLKFAGKKQQIEISEVKNISEVKANMKFVHFLAYFVSVSIFFWLIDIFVADITKLFTSIAIALLLTLFSCWYTRKYGGWVWITYTSTDMQPKEIGFWGAPISGGSQRLYKDLDKLLIQHTLV
jgi:hypothetical protein